MTGRRPNGGSRTILDSHSPIGTSPCERTMAFTGKRLPPVRASTHRMGFCWRLPLLVVLVSFSQCTSFTLATKKLPRRQPNFSFHASKPPAGRPAVATNEVISTVAITKEKLLEQLSADLAELALIRPNLPSADISAPLTIISAGSSYTRLWTNHTWSVHANSPPHKRYLRHVLKWPASSTARMVLPTVCIATAWAALLSVIAKRFNPVVQVLTASGSAATLSYLAAPLALLLTLRANQSMSRLLEARLLWGRMLLHVRGLSSIVKLYLFDQCPHASVFMARHLAVLGWMLKALVRGEAQEYEQEALAIMVRDSRDLSWLSMQPKRTIGIISRVRQAASVALASLPDQHYSSAIHYVVEERLTELELALGGCDRLFTSPIPPTYSRHLSRVIFLWLLLMPMSLICLGLSTAGVSIATAVAAYVLVGLDEVGMEIENAFQLLPLQQLAAATQNAVRDMFVPESGPMPELTAV